MKRRVLIIFATLLLMSVFAFSLSACNSNDDSSNTDDNTNTVNTIAADSLVFGYNVDKNALTNFFIENGEKQNQNEQEYVISNNLATIYYYPQTNKFNIFRQITKNSTLEEAAAAYKYEWTCEIEISLYDLLSNAKYIGSYHHIAVNLNTLNVAAEYTANFKFTVDKYNAAQEMSSFSTTQYNAQITDATDWSSASRMFDSKTEGETIFNQFQYCIDAVSQIFLDISSVQFSTHYDNTDYTAIDFSKTTFENAVHNFDNETHSIYAQNVPNNVLVQYDGNNQSDIGIHTVTAIFKDARGSVLFSLSANIEITDVFNVTVEYIYGNIVSVNGERGFVVGTQTFKAKYNSNILDYCDFPDGFVWKDTSDNWQEFLRDDYTWKGYGDQTFAVSVVPQYEGYVQVTSDTNKGVNNAIIPYAALCSTYEDNTKSAQLFGSGDLVAFKPSDIKTIKIFNTDYLSSFDGTYYTSLETIDLSDCIHLKSIYPDEYGAYGFFDNCKNLKTINAPNLPNLKVIGNNFLANTNIINFNFDMSAVEEIGRNFLYNSLYGDENRIINIDLKSISSINMNGFLGSKDYTAIPTINLFIYDFKITYAGWFDKKASCNIYVSSQVDYYKTLFAEYLNISIYEVSA